jgi:hypothetical protein
MLRDWSGKANHATLTNMDATDWQGDRLDFPGTNEHGLVSDHSSLDITTNLSIVGLIYPDDVTTFTILGKYLSAGDQRSYGLFVIAGKLRLANSTDGTAANAGQWESDNAVVGTSAKGYSFAAVMDGPADNVDLYVDGVEVASARVDTSDFSSVHSGSADLSIGANQGGGSNYFNGRFSFIALYNRSIDSNVILQYYINPKGLLMPKRRAAYFVPAAAGLSMPVAIHHYQQAGML